MIDIAVPRKGRPLEAVLERAAGVADATTRVDDVISTLRYEKAVTKGEATVDQPVYERLAAYSEPDAGPEFTLLRDAREGKPRRVVFDSLILEVANREIRFVGREEPFRALRKHEFALGFDSADLVLEEVVELRPEPLESLAAVNERIDPRDTDVRLVAGLGDTVHHTLLATPETAGNPPLDRDFLHDYQGPLCISPRYERLVEAVVGTGALNGIEFVYTGNGDEEAAISDAGAGVYLTVTGGTARDHGLIVGQQLFPSETVLLENQQEVTAGERAVEKALFGVEAVTV